MKFKKTSSLALPLDAAMRRDLIFFNNPVLMQGLALTPAIAASTTLKNAVVLSLAVLILITPVRVIGDLLYHSVPSRLRMMTYAIIAAALYIPAALVISMIFGPDAHRPGMFLPLLVVDGVMLSRAEIPSREGVGYAVRNGLMTSVGVSLVLIIVGALRELLGDGKLWENQIFANAPLKIAATVAGGFIIVALLSAAVQAIANRYKRARLGGGEK
ncbi:MAG: Rnf-Nqr domain containing protein [Oscillospiraceae bacterium]